MVTSVLVQYMSKVTNTCTLYELHQREMLYINTDLHSIIEDNSLASSGKEFHSIGVIT